MAYSESPFSSTSSSYRRRWNYDVFLSFRGEDTRKHFIDHLYHALNQAGIHTCRADYELSRGEDISSQLLRAIEGSRISVVVFSRNYASSRWCLDELVKIIECRQKIGQVVIPVFYDTDPSDVRKQTGSYAEAFDEHEEHFMGEMEKVNRWREALTQAANLSGWGLKNETNGYEAEFIKKVVIDVACKLGNKTLHVAKHPVGISSKEMNMVRGRTEPVEEHNVFLSFRGEDTRKTITDHLYSALIQAGIRTFRDDNDLPRGEEISPQLLRAIEGSRIFVVVFSYHYASSRWCLDDLVKIMECRQKTHQVVLPIFYHTDPSDVRKQTGSYAKAFDEHEEHFKGEMKKVNRWREALTQAANLSGYGLNETNGYEAELIKKVVIDVACILGNKTLHVAKHPVGISSKEMVRTHYVVPSDPLCLDHGRYNDQPFVPSASNDDDSSSSTTEPISNISPNGRFRRVFTYWEKGELLGRGSFGSVYEGISDDGLFFAVKEVSLLDQGTQGKQSIYQLEQEIALLSRFEHENIVQYYGTDKDESKLYIFLELVTKGSLQKLYQRYNLRDSQVSSYTRQILHGLKYLHDQKVVHRDIKCANLLVDANGSVKLADFGLAKATKLNDVKSCKGTAFWMAPEVVNNKNQGYGLSADIWSLGCTVLEMLTRQIPYSELESMQALFRIGRGVPPLVPDSLSNDARDFILQCLQVNPNDRPTAAVLLDHPFVKKNLSTSLGSASPYIGRRS